MKNILIISILFLSINNGFTWGKIGHYIVGSLAFENLSSDAKAKVLDLLDEQNFAMVANWADEIKSDPNYNHARIWHYITVDNKLEDTKRDSQGDLLFAVEKFIGELSNKTNSKAKRAIALKFLVHFIGDFHMPLHVGKSKDKGGNLIFLNWFGQKTNLHRIWDEHIIEEQRLSYTEYANFLKKHPKYEHYKKLKSSNIKEWINENIELRDFVYEIEKIKDKKYYEYLYMYKVKNILDEQLIKAGFRLAYQIEKII